MQGYWMTLNCNRSNPLKVESTCNTSTSHSLRTTPS